MTESKKRNIITELSDADFLSYLYSERDREESLNSYQGWSIWAISGALITVVYTGYAILCKHLDEFEVVTIGYILSSIFGFLLCYQPFFFFISSLFSRERGVNYKSCKYLKDIVPKPYLWMALIISVTLSLLIICNDTSNRWNVVSITWLIVALMLISATIYEKINHDKIVWSVIDGVLFGERKLDSWFSAFLSGVLSITWVQSVKKVDGSIVGNPNLEIAVCIFSLIALIYLLLKIKTGEKTSSHMDVLLDDFLYNGRSKDDIYNQILTYRMGFGILKACAKELYEVNNSFVDVEPQMAKIKEVNELFSRGTFDINRMIDYFDIIKTVSDFSGEWFKRLTALHNKLEDIGKQVPRIESVEEYQKLIYFTSALL